MVECARLWRVDKFICRHAAVLLRGIHWYGLGLGSSPVHRPWTEVTGVVCAAYTLFLVAPNCAATAGTRGILTVRSFDQASRPMAEASVT